jgi:uncharacterized protein YecA (UPF0149 family)
MLVRKFEIRNQKSETNPKSECFNDQNNISTQRLPGHVPVFATKGMIYAHCKKRNFSPKQPIQVTKVGRNDTCPCGRGKKYKKMLFEIIFDIGQFFSISPEHSGY